MPTTTVWEGLASTQVWIPEGKDLFKLCTHVMSSSEVPKARLYISSTLSHPEPEVF